MGRTPVPAGDRLRAAITALVALLACALIAAGCGNAAVASDDAAGPPQHGGTAVLGMDQEPPCINVWLINCSMAAAVFMTDPLFDSMIDVDDQGHRYPNLAMSVPTFDNGGARLVGSKLIVTIDIQPAAAWNDGTPVSCDDVVFTWKTSMDDRWMIGSRLGWDQIEKIDCPTQKRAVYTFAKPYAPYLRIVGSSLLPRHALEGKDFNKFWNTRIETVNGPFEFEVWKPNVEYVLTRSPNYWNKGQHDYPYLDRMVFKFVKDTNTLKIQLRTGEVDWISPPPDTNLAEELESLPRGKFQIVPGGFWENFAFQNEGTFTKDHDVRLAIAYGLDRQQLTDIVLRKQTAPLHSTLIPTAHKLYFTPAWKKYSYDEDKITEHLGKAGFTRNGGYYEKGGKVLEITFKTTAGNALREKVAQLLQESYRRNGIKVNIAVEPPAVFFGQSAVNGKYDIAEWAWGSDLDPDQTSLFACDQIPSKKNNFTGNNNYRYCNREVTRLLHQADVTPNVAERSKLIKQVQVLMADDVPLVPLYQRPETVAYTDRLQNVKNNPYGGANQMWNVHEWWVTDA